jgi:Virulence factor
MASLVITYWRDIPSQVVAKAGRANEKRMLAERFQEAIDMAAMRSGAAGTDDYLNEWRRGEPAECSDDLAGEVERAAVAIDTDYGPERLKTLIANGGRAAAQS